MRSELEGVGRAPAASAGAGTEGPDKVGHRNGRDEVVARDLLAPAVLARRPRLSTRAIGAADLSDAGVERDAARRAAAISSAIRS